MCNLELVQDKVAIRSAARPLGGKALVGQHFQANAGDIGNVRIKRNRIILLRRIRAAQEDREILLLVENRAAL